MNPLQDSALLNVNDVPAVLRGSLYAVLGARAWESGSGAGGFLRGPGDSLYLSQFSKNYLLSTNSQAYLDAAFDLKSADFRNPFAAPVAARAAGIAPNGMSAVPPAAQTAPAAGRVPWLIVGLGLAAFLILRRS